jgi:O-antigen/teichoic acid export membrane protein
MIPPAGMAMAAITVMLWILWSDTIRARRGPRIVYALRILSYLAMAGVLVWNAVMRPELFGMGGRALVLAAVIVAISGAIYFGRKLLK